MKAPCSGWNLISIINSVDSPPAITLREVSKEFRVTPPDCGVFSRLFSFFSPSSTHRHLVLQNIDLTILPGESVAIIGANGSGKTTLLKIICQITQPTRGSLKVNGRIGSILEIGSGFHPDLTGYENIFLHGSLLGMTKSKVNSRLHDIENFCELGDFLNAPVRHYSLGMVLRLAFSISIHADPDIFIIDEAMAVGDGYFMWKCMKRIRQLKAEGKNLVYVSHVPDQAASLCDRAIWLDNGQIRADGAISDVLQQYHQFQFQWLLDGAPPRSNPELSAMIPYSRFGTGELTIHNVTFWNGDGQQSRFFQTGEQLEIKFEVLARQPAKNVAVYFILECPNRSVTFRDSSQNGKTYSFSQGSSLITLRLPSLMLHPGPYVMTIGIGKAGFPDQLYDAHQKVYNFTVTDNPNSRKTYSAGFFSLPVTFT